jgi:dTDP-4-dehydrorhamnose reductase
MKILIVGSTGMLGSAVKKYFNENSFEVVTLDRERIDLSNFKKEEVGNLIEESGCDVLINCAGLIKQRSGLKTRDFISVNSLLPHTLADLCLEKNIKMIHVTTDCIFSGRDGNYNEMSKSDVFDDYGLSKFMGEPNICTTIRTSIIGEEYKNKLSLLEWIRSNKGGKINGYTNHTWNGVTCLQLSKIIHNIITNNRFWVGTRHIFSNSVNKYELAKIINEIYELNIQIDPMETSEKIDRSLSSIHGTEEFNIPPLDKQILETKLFHLDIK